MPSTNASPGGILALDLASVVGVAYGPRDGAGAPRLWCWQLPKHGGLGAKLASFENELLNAITVLEPSLIIREAALPAQAQVGNLAALLSLGLLGFVEATGWRNDIPVHAASSGTVRKAILGRGTFPAGTAKQHVAAFCDLQGWKYPTLDAADAAITWLYACRELSAGRRLAA